MKFTRFAVLAMATLFVAACLPVTTKNPVGTTVGFKADPALVGLWRAEPDKSNKDDDKTGFIAFLNAEAEGTMTGLMIAPAKGAGDWGSYRLKPARLGANHYLNAWPVMNNDRAAEPNEAKSDFLLLYRFGKDGRLMLYLLNEDATRTAVKAGKIRGEIEPGSSGDVHITADPKDLAAFFASKQGAALFVKPFATMHRVN
jgi:hypothetical protein